MSRRASRAWSFAGPSGLDLEVLRASGEVQMIFRLRDARLG